MEWKAIELAPKDGSEIVGDYGDGDECSIVWSDNPVCMLGRRAGSFRPGWATSNNGDTDANLPMDAPLRWRWPTPNAEFTRREPPKARERSGGTRCSMPTAKRVLTCAAESSAPDQRVAGEALKATAAGQGRQSGQGGRTYVQRWVRLQAGPDERVARAPAGKKAVRACCLIADQGVMPTNRRASIIKPLSIERYLDFKVTYNT